MTNQLEPNLINLCVTIHLGHLELRNGRAHNVDTAGMLCPDSDQFESHTLTQILSLTP